MFEIFGMINLRRSKESSPKSTSKEEEDRKSSIESFEKDSSWRKSFDDHGVTDSSWRKSYSSFWKKSYDDHGVTDSYWPVSYFDRAASEESSLQSQRKSILGKAKDDKLDVVQNDSEVGLEYSHESELVLENDDADDVFDASANPTSDSKLEDYISIEEMIMTEEVLNEILEADDMYMQSGGGCFDNWSTSSSDRFFPPGCDESRKRSDASMLKDKYSFEVTKDEIMSLHEMIMTEEVLNEILDADYMSNSSADGASMPSSVHTFLYEDFRKRSSATLLKEKASSLKGEVSHSFYFTDNLEDTSNIFDDHSDSWKQDPAIDGRKTDKGGVCHSVYFSEELEDNSNTFDDHLDSWKQDPSIDGRKTTAVLDSSNLATQSVPLYPSRVLAENERSPSRKTSIESLSATSRTEIVQALANSFANIDRNQDSNVQLDEDNTSDFQELEHAYIPLNDRPSFTKPPSKQSCETTCREEDLLIEEEKSIKTITDTLFLSEEQHAWLNAEEFEFFFGFPLHAFHHIIQGSYE